MLDGLGDKLTQRLGPLPVWGWGVVAIGGALAGYALVRRRGGSAGADSRVSGVLPADYGLGMGAGSSSAGGGSPVGGGGGATAWNPFDMGTIIPSNAPVKSPVVPVKVTAVQPPRVLDLLPAWISPEQPVRVGSGWSTAYEVVQNDADYEQQFDALITEQIAPNLHVVETWNPGGRSAQVVDTRVADITNRAEEYNRAAQSGNRPVDMGAAIRELQRLGAS